MKTPKYDCWTIIELQEKIHEKTIIVPTLQRDMVWADKDVKKLQDSIMKGFPIGTLIFNKVKENGRDIYYLLDGLQRTTSLIKIIKDKYQNLSISHINDIIKLVKEDGKKNNISFDDINIKAKDILKIIVDNSDAFSRYETPQKVDHLYNASIFNNASKMHNKYSFFNYFVDKLLKMLPNESYPVPYIAYEDDNLDNSAEIFELLNTQGTRLTELEILASSWNKLSIEINKTKFGDNFLKIVKHRYVSLKELGLKRQDVNINKFKITPFEFIYGIAIKIGEKTKWNQLSTLFIVDGKIQNLNIMLFLLKWFLFHFIANNEHEIKNKDVGRRIVEVFNNNTSYIEKFINFMVQVSDGIKEKFPIFSFKSNAKDNSKNILFGASYMAWFLINYIKTNYNHDFSPKDAPLKSNEKIMMEFIYKLIDETFGSASVKKAYKDVLRQQEVKPHMLIDTITSKNSQLSNDSKRINFPHWVKVLMSYIYIKESKDYTYEIWHIRRFEEDHLIPKAILNNLYGQSGLCNYSLIINKQNLAKSDNVDIKYLESDFIYKIANEASQCQQRKLYLSFQNEVRQRNYLSFLEARLPVIIALIEKHFK